MKTPRGYIIHTITQEGQMNKTTHLLGTIFVCVVMITAGTLHAQDKKPTPEQMAAMMEKWKVASSPNENHKKLDALVGSWEVETRFWMNGPDQPPSVSKGTAEYHWILGGRFLEETVKSEMMGMPFEGYGLNGYDNLRKKYTFSWVDNTSTGLFTGDGTADPTGKVITSFGKMDDPMTGEMDKEVKYVLRIVSKDKLVFEMYDLQTSDKMNGELVYTRKK